MISIDKFFETELKVGIIKQAEFVESSHGLYKLTVDLGEETPRTILSKVAKYYQPEELVDKQVCVVANLEEKTILGIKSQGMVLMADGEKPILISPLSPVNAGTKLT